jgi:S-(hydroxymethyl)glutathione dehydrogenase / alcohol dehydrogenase
MQCRAAILEAPGQNLVIDTVETGPLQPQDVLVRIGAAGICHTDLEVISGQLVYPMPIVLGHEAAGTIVEVGDGVSRSRIGERVVLSWNPHCGHCFYCDAGQPILCEIYTGLGPKAVHFDGSTRLSRNGTPVHTMFYLSAFAEYSIVSAQCAIPVPAEMPLDRACLLGCGVLTGVGGATRVGNIAYGETAMVIGCGAVGLAAIQGARLAGASQIVAVDLDDTKLAISTSLGATHTVNAQNEDPVAAVKAITNGRGADCVLEAAGNERGFRLSAEACRVGGRIVWLGKVGIDQDVAFRWGSLMGEKRIVRSSYGGAQTAQDFPHLSRSYLDGKLKLDELITRRIALEQINEGFDDLRNGRAIRTVIVFDGR